MGKITGKIAVITGGAQPNSLAMAKKLAQEEAKAVVILTKNAAEDAAQIKAQGEACYAYQCNIADFADVTRCFDAIKAELGDIDILINNPNAACNKTLLETTPEEWNEVLATNVHSLFYCCKQVYADMKARKTGKVINFSNNAMMGVAGNAAYAITMGSAVGFTGTCAREGEKYTMTACSLTPADDATPEEVANAVAMLASEEGRTFHGQHLKVTHSWLDV